MCPHHRAIAPGRWRERQMAQCSQLIAEHGQQGGAQQPLLEQLGQTMQLVWQLGWCRSAISRRR